MALAVLSIAVLAIGVWAFRRRISAVNAFNRDLAEYRQATARQEAEWQRLLGLSVE